MRRRKIGCGHGRRLRGRPGVFSTHDGQVADKAAAVTDDITRTSAGGAGVIASTAVAPVEPCTSSSPTCAPASGLLVSWLIGVVVPVVEGRFIDGSGGYQR